MLLVFCSSVLLIGERKIGDFSYLNEYRKRKSPILLMSHFGRIL